MTSNNKVVLVIGVFDLFHRGHVEFLKKARSAGDTLVVLINGDKFTETYKRKPIFSEEDRAEIVRSCRYVDKVDIVRTADVKPFIEKYSVDEIVHGNDWPHEDYMRQICVTEKYLSEKKVNISYTEYYSGMSTSNIIQELKTNENRA